MIGPLSDRPPKLEEEAIKRKGVTDITLERSRL